MVLFDNDFVKEGALVHHLTKNASFIRMHVILSKLQVKNNKFFLAIYDRSLMEIDPHDPKLTQQQIEAIVIESYKNPWYFFREVVRIPVTGSDPVRYILNRANLSLLWLFLNSVDIFLTMPRQVGKTVGTCSLISYLMYVIGKNLTIGSFAKDAKLRGENVSRVKELRNALPKYFYKIGPMYTNDNQEGIDNKVLNTQFMTFVAQSDKNAARGQGRGQSLAIEHWDELAHYVNNELSYQSAVSASITAMEQAKKAGIPCANIITTTAGVLEEPHGKYAHGIKDGCLRFNEKLYDMTDIDELKSVIANGSRISMVYCEFSYKQLGKTEEWFKQNTKNLSDDIIAIDFLNKWIHGGKSSLLPKSILDKLVLHEEEPTAITFLDSLMFTWYADPKVIETEFINYPFILSSDTSDNLGKDYTTLVLIDPADLGVVMTCRCNDVNQMYIAKCIIRLLLKYPNLIFIPERNRAATLIDAILHAFEGDKSFNPFKRIYNTYVQDNKIKTSDFSDLDISDGRVRKAFGFTTTKSSSSRELLYGNVLSSVVNKNYKRIRDSVIISEICGLILKNGRLDHSSSGHDDLLVAYLIGCWFVMYGRNHRAYGLESSNILSCIDEDGDTVDPQEKERQAALVARCQFLRSQLDKNNLSSVIRASYERELTNTLPLISHATAPTDVIGMSQVSVNKLQDTPVVRDTFKISEMMNLIKF